MQKVLLLIAVASLVACSKDEVSFDTLETARATAKANAEYNAQIFRSSSTRYANYALEVQGDSSQLAICPQGDGWASAKLVDKDKADNLVRLKCSTVSSTVGCMTQTEFQTKPYAADDGKCQPTSKVPFPLPKVAK